MGRSKDMISNELDSISLDLHRLHARVLRIACEINPDWERRRNAEQKRQEEMDRICAKLDGAIEATRP